MRNRLLLEAKRRGSWCSLLARYGGAVQNHYPVPVWVGRQVYLHPYPKEPALRNHV